MTETKPEKQVKHRRMQYKCVAKSRVTTADGHMNPGDIVKMYKDEAEQYGDFLEKA